MIDEIGSPEMDRIVWGAGGFGLETASAGITGFSCEEEAGVIVEIDSLRCGGAEGFCSTGGWVETISTDDTVAVRLLCRGGSVMEKMQPVRQIEHLSKHFNNSTHSVRVRNFGALI